MSFAWSVDVRPFQMCLILDMTHHNRISFSPSLADSVYLPTRVSWSTSGMRWWPRRWWPSPCRWSSPCGLHIPVRPLLPVHGPTRRKRSQRLVPSTKYCSAGSGCSAEAVSQGLPQHAPSANMWSQLKNPNRVKQVPEAWKLYSSSSFQSVIRITTS